MQISINVNHPFHLPDTQVHWWALTIWWLQFCHTSYSLLQKERKNKYS